MSDMDSLFSSLGSALESTVRLQKLNELALMINIVITLRQAMSSGVLDERETRIFTKLLDRMDSYLEKLVGDGGE